MSMVDKKRRRNNNAFARTHDYEKKKKGGGDALRQLLCDCKPHRRAVLRMLLARLPLVL